MRKTLINRHICRKTITLAVVSMFLFVSMTAVANPAGRGTLSAQPVFGLLSDVEVMDISVIRYYLLCLSKSFDDLNSIPWDVKKWIKELSLYMVLKNTSDELRPFFGADADSHIIHASVNDKEYYAYVTDGSDMGEPVITVFTGEEFSRVRNKKRILHSKRSEEQAELIRSSEATIDDYWKDTLFNKNELTEKALNETGGLIKGEVLKELFGSVFQDVYIAENILKISGGARSNLMLKSYQMMAEGAASGETILYLRKRLKECMWREEDLLDAPLISWKVQIPVDAGDCPVHSIRLLAKVFGVSMEEQNNTIEFLPSPSKDWKDAAELLDTMKSIGMIPQKEGAVIPFHINLLHSTNLKNKIPWLDISKLGYKVGVSNIALIEALLFSSDERLEKLHEEGLPAYIIRGGPGNPVEIGGKTYDGAVEHLVGNLANDGQTSNYREALRMAQIMYTALLAYLSDRYAIRFSNAYAGFHSDYCDFENSNNIQDLINFAKDGYGREGKSWGEEVIRRRKEDPGMVHELGVLVGKHLNGFEEIRGGNVNEQLLSDREKRAKAKYLIALEKEVTFQSKPILIKQAPVSFFFHQTHHRISVPKAQNQDPH